MKKRWFALCMCIVMLAGKLTSCGTNTGKIKFGAAGLGGTYRVFGDTFANLVTSKNKKYKMEVKTTAGSAANLRLLSDGYIQMAVAQTDLTMMPTRERVFLRMKSSMEVIVQLLHCIQKRVRLL